MRAIFRLIDVSDTSALDGVAHVDRATFDYEVKTLESVTSRRQCATRILGEVLCFAFVETGTEVQRAIEPDS